MDTTRMRYQTGDKFIGDDKMTKTVIPNSSVQHCTPEIGQVMWMDKTVMAFLFGQSEVCCE